MATAVDGRFGNLYKKLLKAFASQTAYDYATFVNCYNKTKFGVKLSQLRLSYKFCTDSRFFYKICTFVKSSLLKDESSLQARLCALFTLYVFYYDRMKEKKIKIEFSYKELCAAKDKFFAGRSSEALRVLDTLVMDNAFSFVLGPCVGLEDCSARQASKRRLSDSTSEDDDVDVDNFCDYMKNIHLECIIDQYFAVARENKSSTAAENICFRLYDREKRDYAKKNPFLTLDSNDRLQPAPYFQKYYENYKKVLVAKNDPFAMKTKNHELAAAISKSLSVKGENGNVNVNVMGRKNSGKNGQNLIDSTENDRNSSVAEFENISSESYPKESDECEAEVILGP